MYMLYIDQVLFPVAPGKIVTETENENREVELVDGSFITRPGGRGLRRFSFELLLPMSEYPFATYEDSFKDGVYFIDELNRIAAENVPVWFDLYRTMPDANKTYLTNIQVVPEKITIVEDASNGMDMLAKVELLEYRNVETKTAKEKRQTGYTQRESDYELPDTYTVKSGDSLWLISKKFFDDGSKYTYLAQINSIKKPYTIYTGQVLKLKEK